MATAATTTNSTSRATPRRKCGCKCTLRCTCDCPCQDHCTCDEDCKGLCGKKDPARNLVVSIDGTSNQFGQNNTNVVELHSRVKTDHASRQLTFYVSGIGTYAPAHSTSLKSLSQRMENLIDLAIAWNFEKIVQQAYGWLADNYQPGDRIFLFGFSRGAYQVRTLAGMIQKMGLVHAGNSPLIPFAYELYADRHKGKRNRNIRHAEAMARKFKETFARDVKVHFTGVWDTVSSVGLVRGKVLPFSASHVCFFRHALALDERRVKYLPEYIDQGSSTGNVKHATSQASPNKWKSANTGNLAGLAETADRSRDSQREHGAGRAKRITDVPARKKIKENKEPVETSDGAESEGRVVSVTSLNIKEVWFAGTHLDIGGGAKPNLELNLSSTPLLWMENEATATGLRLRLRASGGEWKWDDLRKDKTTPSLKWKWWPLEIIPFRRLTYHRFEETTCLPHLGQGRTIVPHQTVHASVAFKQKEYFPMAATSWIGPKPYYLNWSSLVGQGEIEDLSWAENWQEHLEMDLFDASYAERVMKDLRSIMPSDKKAQLGLVKRLSFIALSGRGAENIIKLNGAEHLVELFSSNEKDIQVASALCLCRLIDNNNGDAISNSIPVEQLKKMLSNNDFTVQVASFECLSRLAVRPYDIDELPHVCRGSESAQNVFLEHEDSWIPILSNMLTETSAGSVAARAASCLARLTAHSEIRRIFQESISADQDEDKDTNPLPVASGESESVCLDKLDDVMRRIAVLLDNPQTRCDGALTLAHFAKSGGTMNDDILKKVVSFLDPTFDWKIRRACIVCLSCYANSVTVQKILSETNFVNIMVDMLKPPNTSAIVHRNLFRRLISSANGPSYITVSASAANDRRTAARHIHSFISHAMLKPAFGHAHVAYHIVSLLVDDLPRVRDEGEKCVIKIIEDASVRKDVQNNMRTILASGHQKQRFLLLVALQHLIWDAPEELLDSDLISDVFNIVVNSHDRIGVRIQAVGALKRGLVRQAWSKNSTLQVLDGLHVVSKCVELLHKVDESVMCMEEARAECGLDANESIGYDRDNRDQTSTAGLGATMLRCLAQHDEMIGPILDSKAVEAMTSLADRNNNDTMRSVVGFVFGLADKPSARKRMFDSEIVPRLIKIRDSTKYLEVQLQAAEVLALLAHYDDSLPYLPPALRERRLDAQRSGKDRSSIYQEARRFLRNVGHHHDVAASIVCFTLSPIDGACQLLEVNDSRLVAAATDFLVRIVSRDRHYIDDAANMVLKLLEVYNKELGWQVKMNVQNMFAQYASEADTRDLVTTPDVLRTLQHALKYDDSDVCEAGLGFLWNIVKDDKSRAIVCAGSFIEDQVKIRDSDHLWLNQWAAQQTLAILADYPDAVPRLLTSNAVINALSSTDDDVQRGGCVLLQKLAPHHNARSTMLDNDLINRLIVLSHENYDHVRAAAIATLLELLKYGDVRAWADKQDSESLQEMILQVDSAATTLSPALSDSTPKLTAKVQLIDGADV